MNDLVRIEGGPELIKALKKIAPEFLRVATEAIQREGVTIESAAQLTVPRGTGALAASCVVSHQTGAKRSSTAVAYTLDRAAAVHEGVHWGHHHQTKGMKWFERAFYALKPQALARIVADLKRLVGGK